MKKNCKIEIYRFAFAIFIAMHHSFVLDSSLQLCRDGWVYTEFFFILTGFLTAQHLHKHPTNNLKTGIIYVINKIKYILPIAYLCILWDFILFWKTSAFDNATKIKAVAQIPFNLMFLTETGLVSYKYCDTLWYVGELIISLPILVTIAIKIPDVFKYLLSWLIPLYFYSQIFINYGNVQIWGEGVQKVCFYRGIAGMSLGMLCFYIYSLLNEKYNLTTIPIRVTVHLFVIIILYYLIYSVFTGKGYFYNAEIILAEAVLITITMLVPNGNFFNNSLIYKLSTGLGKLSMPIYCLNWVVFSWFENIYRQNGLKYSLKILFTFCMILILLISYIYVRMIEKYQNYRTIITEKKKSQ